MADVTGDALADVPSDGSSGDGELLSPPLDGEGIGWRAMQIIAGPVMAGERAVE